MRTCAAIAAVGLGSPAQAQSTPPSLGRPIPIDPPPISVKTASANIPPVMDIPTIPERKPPTVDRQSPTPAPALEKTMSYRERRTELRQMGLQDPSMKLFNEQVGAPPPAQNAATSASLLNRPQPTAAPKAVETVEAEPRPSALKRMAAKFAPSNPAPNPAPAPNSGIVQVSTNPPAQAPSPGPTTESPGLLSRLFGSRTP